MITDTQLIKLKAMLASGDEHSFYTWSDWRALREYVLDLDNHECQICKTKYHRYRAATIVHHVKHLRDRPDLALSLVDPDTGERQLVSVCKQCHEDEHPEALQHNFNWTEPVTEERWD